MANSYYDMTGVLCLKDVTPVIRALFGGLSIDPDHPGSGEVYFCNMAEINSHTWDSVLEELIALADSLGIDLEDDDSGEEVESDCLLWARARHFG